MAPLWGEEAARCGGSQTRAVILVPLFPGGGFPSLSLSPPVYAVGLQQDFSQVVRTR